MVAWVLTEFRLRGPTEADCCRVRQAMGDAEFVVKPLSDVIYVYLLTIALLCFDKNVTFVLCELRFRH